MWKFIDLTYLFLEKRWVKSPNVITSNMCANSPDQWHSLHTGHHYYPINNESNPGNIVSLCGLISGCVKRTVKRFSFVFFIHHCKTVIKADQTSSFYPSIDVILYQKYLKKGDAIATMSFHLKLQKQTNQNHEYSILKVHLVSSFARAFLVYIHLVVNNDYFASQPCAMSGYGSIYPWLNSESSQTSLFLAVVLMYLFSFWDGLYWSIISILDTRLCLTSLTVLQSG